MDVQDRNTALATASVAALALSAALLFLPWLEIDARGDTSLTLRSLVRMSDWDDGSTLQRWLYDDFFKALLVGSAAAAVPWWIAFGRDEQRQVAWVAPLAAVAWAGYFVVLLQDAVEGAGALSLVTGATLEVGSGAWVALGSLVGLTAVSGWLGMSARAGGPHADTSGTTPTADVGPSSGSGVVYHEGGLAEVDEEEPEPFAAAWSRVLRRSEQARADG